VRSPQSALGSSLIHLPPLVLAASCSHFLRASSTIPLARSTCPLARRWATETYLSYRPPWAHYLGGYQDRLLGGPLRLPGLRYTTPVGVEHKDYGGEVLGWEAVHVPHCMESS
jgi:hypothetical protein